MTRTLDQTVAYIKNLGDQLVRYNFPNADPRLEDELTYIKTHKLRVDGYPIIIHFTRADYKNHYLENLQILPEKVPFLPFFLVHKLAKKFLGSEHLSLVEVYRDNQKVYCWSVALNRRGVPIPNPNAGEGEKLTFEGFKYDYLDPKQVNIY